MGGLCFAADRGLTVSTEAPSADRKIALVIGNGDYENSPLANPVKDAKAMSETLARLGFEVIAKQNATMAVMMESIQVFGKKLRKGGVGLFYFAGHGIQFNGDNYLIPIKLGFLAGRQTQS